MKVTLLVDPEDLVATRVFHTNGEFVGNLDDIMEWGRYRPTLTRMALLSNVDDFNKLNTWRKTMAARVFTIELKMDLDTDDEKFKPMTVILGRAALDLMASAVLLTATGKKPPGVVMFTEDQFFEVQDIPMVDDEGNPVTDGSNEGVTDAVDADQT